MEEPPMSNNVKTRTLWRCSDASWIDTEKDCDCMALTMQSGGEVFAVVVSGPKGMKSDRFVPAVQAAAAALVAACGGDPSVVGACAADQLDMFDTGDQRAN